jgi:hypothetical protein
MVSNVTKKTFFLKFFKLNFFAENLSLKQLIQRELLIAIALYQQQHPEVNNWQQITASISEKIILCYPQNSFGLLGYRCAITFPIANLVNLSPLLIANQLVRLLPSQSKNTPDGESESLEIAVVVLKSGWIDFYICARNMSRQSQNRNLIIWLNRLIAGIINQTHPNYLDFLPRECQKLDDFFPLQYIYARCDSLLSLGEREGLIRLETKRLSNSRWLIKQPFSLKWCDSQNNFYLIKPQEWDLLKQICLMLDLLGENKEHNTQDWLKLTKNISEAWLKFISSCPFCGDVSQQTPQLAIVRLNLIALTHWCLETILMFKLGIIPHSSS